MFLIDTNIFLEILLNQEKKEICKQFLNSNLGKLYLSDFSLHSIGVILLRDNKSALFKLFIEDINFKIEVLSLPNSEFVKLVENADFFKLDFDDAYQLTISQMFNLKIVTMDKDFKRINNNEIIFL